MSILRALSKTLREVERGIAESMTAWVMRQHSPLEVEPGVVVCWACRKHPAWPCSEYAKAADRLTTLQGKTT